MQVKATEVGKSPPRPARRGEGSGVRGSPESATAPRPFCLLPRPELLQVGIVRLVSAPERIGDLVPPDTLVLATDRAGRTRSYGRFADARPA